MSHTPLTTEQARLDQHRLTLQALMNRIDRIPRADRLPGTRRLLAAQSEALRVAIQLIQDAITQTEGP